MPTHENKPTATTVHSILKGNRFPTTHLAAIVILGLCLCPFVVARFIHAPANENIHPEPEPLELSVQQDILAAVPGSAPDPAGSDTIAQQSGPITETLEVRSGDSLSILFKRRGIPAGDLHRLVHSQPFGPRLKSIYPGHQLKISIDSDNRLTNLSYSPGPLETLQFTRVGDGFAGTEVIAEPERLTLYRHGIIDHSLFVASQRAGLEDSVTLRLAEIFQWDIDFVLDIRAGDAFHVLLEELHLGGQSVGYGDILAAEFVNQGDVYRAVLYRDSTGKSNYYDPAGKSMRKAFLRAPVSFTRISSNFNLRRKHPMWNRAMPHRGIDYAAPTGTPVRASGHGTVVKAGRTQANGNYVVIRHGEQFVTKYLHLSGFARGIRANATVRQGQTIGYVGSTGWATGPHLHYEFLVYGVHQNPRTVRLPDADPVPEAELAHFSSTAEPLFAQLDSRKQTQLAYLSR